MASLFHNPPSISSSLLFFFLLFLLISCVQVVKAQQPYGTEIADCSNPHNASGLLGYFCSSGSAPSCPSFLTFTSRAPYTTLSSIASLLGADAASLASANAATNAAAPLADGTKVLVPATCACTTTPTGRFYQRNASTYVVQPGDTLLIIANNTFQGLTSCQALQAQGLGAKPAAGLLAGQPLPVPLRCACPTASQAASGARFLVSYLVGFGDDVSAVAKRFGVDAQVIVDANELQSPFTIYPFTTLLVPVTAQPNESSIQTPPSPPPPPPTPTPAVVAGKKSGSSHVGVYIGVAVAVVVAVAGIASAGAFLFLKARRRRRRAGAVLAAADVGGLATKKDGKGGDATSSGFTTGGGEVSLSLSTSEALSSISVTDIKSSLKVYTYAELQAATDGFSPGRRIGGSSVYRAAFGGDAAAVEVVDRNVSAEVEIMRKLNHLNLIRLIGLSHHAGRWYLVTEYAEGGALRDRLLLTGGGGADGEAATPPLSWEQRVKVALDVAEGLRYLHEYARQPCVHMDVSTGTVLLAGDAPRAKLRGFAAARAITGATAGVGAEGAEEVMFTMTSRIAGTRGYIAPEYLEHGVVSPKADVYSLGVVLLELLTGRDAEELVGDGVGDPFASLRELAEELDGGGGGAVMQRLEEIVDPAMPAGSCPQDAVVMMVRLIERCVRREPAGRPSTGEVAQRLLKMSGVSVVSWHNSPESPRSSGSGKGLM